MGKGGIDHEKTVWDKKFKEDVKSGRFFWVTNKSVIDFKRGHFKSFWKLYDNLPSEVQSLAEKIFISMNEKTNEPSKNIIRVGRYWSMRIGEKHRALGVEVDEDGLLWCWVGTYSDYNNFVAEINNNN